MLSTSTRRFGRVTSVDPLEPPHSHYLSAAVGWLGLNNPAEAEAELAQLGAALQQHPDVLEVRWQLRAVQERWEDALQIARSLIHAAPDRPSGWIDQAYALRRVPTGGLRAAWNALFPAAAKFPLEPTISYNLACYACQMHHHDEARVWLRRSFNIDPEYRERALVDPDLESLRHELHSL